MAPCRMTILIKYPTRGRPQQFLKTLRGWLEAASDLSQLAVLVSYDTDDATMTAAVIAEAEKLHPTIVCVGGTSASKIAACNRDLPEYGGDWDVVLLISDDMFCRRRAWDERIRENMQKYFPDTDGSLWFWDQAQRKINTLPCLGHKFYDRFHYIYEPSYSSFWVDNEQTEVGLALKRLVFIEDGICSHEHPAWLGGMKTDATYRRNHPYWAKDEATFNRRKALGFPK